jgi:hypothetical protein
VAEGHRILVEDSLGAGILAVGALVEDIPGMVKERPKLELDHSLGRTLMVLGPVRIRSAWAFRLPERMRLVSHSLVMV